jgi:hypothetical protein
MNDNVEFMKHAAARQAERDARNGYNTPVQSKAALNPISVRACQEGYVGERGASSLMARMKKGRKAAQGQRLWEFYVMKFLERKPDGFLGDGRWWRITARELWFGAVGDDENKRFDELAELGLIEITKRVEKKGCHVNQTHVRVVVPNEADFISTNGDL